MIDNKKISILLLGPGHGNNIDSLLDLLFLSSEFRITLLTSKYGFDKSKYVSLQVVEFRHANRIVQRLRIIRNLLRMKQHDFLVILGGSNLFEVIPVVLFAKRKKTIFNIWGETIPQLLGKNGIKATIYKQILKSVDAIFCNWYGTRNIIVENAPYLEFKIYIQGWGLSRDFTEQKPIVSDFTADFLKSMPENKCVFLNMRSIDYYNEIDKILAALLILKNSYPSYFERVLCVFWHGNNVIDGLQKKILDFIELHGLKEHLWCVKHPFVPSSDIRHIVDRADVVVNFVNRDQLSGSVLEGMFLKKQLIMSDIRPYRILNEECKTGIKLIPVTAAAFADEMMLIMDQLSNGNIDDELLDFRKCVVEKRFTRANNVAAIAAKFNEILSK